MGKNLKCELWNDSFQNRKKYPIQKAQLVIADVPYNVGTNFYGSNPMWYKGGDNKNGESKLAGKAAFASDFNFNLYEYFHFCSQLMKKEPKHGGVRGRSSDAPCMIVFCSFEQQSTLINAAAKHGFVNYIPLVFIKNYSPQVLKANMRVVGATEYALLFYRSYLPKFRNGAQYDENGKTKKRLRTISMEDCSRPSQAPGEYLYRIFGALNREFLPYYTSTAVAWTLAEAFCCYPKETLDFLSGCELDGKTYNRALQKMVESLIPQKDVKDYLRGLKRKPANRQ